MELLAGYRQFDRCGPVESSECLRAGVSDLDNISLQSPHDLLQREPATACGRHRLGELRLAQVTKALSRWL